LRVLENLSKNDKPPSLKSYISTTMIEQLALRVLQILFSLVVFALSIVLIKDFGPGHSWSLTNYGAFCGAGGLIFALIGVASLFVNALEGIVVLITDAIASFFLVAGGIAYAVTIKVGSCNDFGYLANHKNPFLVSPDKIFTGDSVGSIEDQAEADVTGRCRETQASTAFIWFAFAAFLGSIVFHFLSGGKRRGTTGSYA